MKKRELLSLFLFITLILVIIMDGYLILPNQVLIAADLGIYFDTPGILIGVYIIVTGVSVICFGYLTDKIERKQLLIFAGFLWSIVAILHIVAVEFWLLLLLRIFAAIATGVTTPLTISYLADIVSSKSRAKTFALWSLFSTLASLIGGVLALMFNKIPFEEIDIDSGSIRENINFIKLNFPNLLSTWRYPFLILGILALILTIINLLIIEEPKRAAKDKYFEDILSDEAHRYTYKIKFRDLRFIFKRKSNLFLIMNLFDVVASGLLVAYIFPYFELELGINASNISTLIVLLLIVLPLGLIIGQFGLAHWGDKKVQRGDLSGRVKVATICSILTLPFLLLAFSMSPNVRAQTFFFGRLIVNTVGFWTLWIIFSSLLGVGLAFTFGIAPNWYASLIDLNLPEHRGTMVAMGSFVDTFGRALGTIIGGFMITFTDNFSSTIFWSTLIFGIISTFFWIPLFFTGKKDFIEIDEILKNRAKEINTRKLDENKENYI